MQDPEVDFQKALDECKMSSDLVERLLSLRCMTDSGNHQRGDRMFWMVESTQATEGDREKVVSIERGIAEWVVTSDVTMDEEG